MMAVACLSWQRDTVSALALAGIGASTVPTRQLLMPAINAAADAGATRQFKLLHTLSVLVTLVHIGLAGWVLARFA